MSRVMAGCFALAAFAVAIVAGLAADNAAGIVLMRALMAMILCYPVGYIAGAICDHVIQSHTHASVEDAATDSDAAHPEASQPDQQEKEVLTV